jgi:glycerophosphoryl diester phosphodiesterase
MGSGVSTAMGWESLTRLATAARFGLRPRGVVRAPFAHVPLRLHRLPVFVERLVSMVHELGAQLLVWTVDDAARMHRLLDYGVDGIITDRPDVLRDVLVGRGGWTAPALA